jgi:hypothetical protein
MRALTMPDDRKGRLDVMTAGLSIAWDECAQRVPGFPQSKIGDPHRRLASATRQGAENYLHAYPFF